MELSHIANPFTPSDRREQLRLERAQSTWKQASLTQSITPCYIRTEDLKRTSKTQLQDSRTLPFIKDVIDLALTRNQGRYFFFTNSDSCLVSDIGDALRLEFTAEPENRIAFSHRRNFSRFPKRWLSCDDIEGRGEPFIGIDLVAFDRVWWENNRVLFPDLILGCEGWDWVFKFWPGAVQLPELIYHEYHYPPYWMANRMCPAELWNKARCLEWVSSQANRGLIEREWPTLDEYRLHLNQCSSGARTLANWRQS